MAKAIEFSLKAIVGFSTLGTIKLKGAVQDKKVIVLIDCATTHNFIFERLTKELKLPRAETANYGVIMGSGVAMKGRGICRGGTLLA